MSCDWRRSLRAKCSSASIMTIKVALSAKLKGSNWIGMAMIVGIDLVGKGSSDVKCSLAFQIACVVDLDVVWHCYLETAAVLYFTS